METDAVSTRADHLRYQGLLRDFVRVRDENAKLRNRMPLGTAVLALKIGEPLAFIPLRTWERIKQLDGVKAILEAAKR